MTSGIFLIIIAAYQIIRALTGENIAAGKQVYQQQLNPVSPGQLLPEKRIEYIVNNKSIPCPFERYYYIKLKMPLPIISIEQEAIERHYQDRMQNKEQEASNINDIEAANKFFTDRINYFSHLN